MADANGESTDQPVFKSTKAPCVYCGKVIDRGVARCPHCHTSYSFAVRKATREAVGEWFYLDPRNPSSRGVTFETLIKMIEKGRLKPDSVVRGPTTHQDWMYAAEAPRLAKYLRLCPHCFAEAKPEDTYCTHCQLNMNERPADARPDAVPADIKDPYHLKAYQLEERLAEAAKAEHEPPTPAARRPPTAPAAAPKPEPRPSATAAAAAAAVAESAADRFTRVAAIPHRKRPKLWIVLVLTWITLIPILILMAIIVPGFPLHDWVHSTFRGSEAAPAAPSETPLGPDEDTSASPPPGSQAGSDQHWLKCQLALADAAEQKKDYQAAVRIFEQIIEKTGDESWQQRISTLRQKQERRKRSRRLRDRLEMAEDLADQKRYDDALAVLRNIGREDRSLLASLGVGVGKMEASIRTAKAEHEKGKQQKQLADRLAAAEALREEGKLEQALVAYHAIGDAFDADMVAASVDLAKVIQTLEAEIAEGEAAQSPSESEGEEPEAPPEEVAKAIAALMAKAASLEEDEKFDAALAVLEKIKEKFSKKFWPDNLEERVQQVEKRKKVADFFGME